MADLQGEMHFGGAAFGTEPRSTLVNEHEARGGICVSAHYDEPEVEYK